MPSLRELAEEALLAKSNLITRDCEISRRQWDEASAALLLAKKLIVAERP